MSPTAEEIIETAHEILSRPEFQQTRDSDYGLMKQFQDWLLQAIPPEAWTALFYLLIGAIALGLFWILVKNIGRLISYIVDKPLAVAIPKKPVMESPAEKNEVSCADPKACLYRGDTKAAIKALHHALLTSLESRELITRKKWKTNSRYAEECKSDPRWQHILFSISRDFEQSFYGSIEIEAHHIETQISRFEAEARK